MTFKTKHICVSIERFAASYLPRSELYGQAQPSSPLYRTRDGALARYRFSYSSRRQSAETLKPR
jgi:hypothetical protein